LTRQNTIPLNASFTKIQGMIEAPLLSYAQSEINIGTLSQLSGSFSSISFGNVWNGSTNTGAGSYGPYSHTYTTAATSLTYSWEFTLNATLSCATQGNIATTGSNRYASLGNNLIFIDFPLDSGTAAHTLILIIGIDFVTYTGNPTLGGMTIKSGFVTGDPSLSQATWSSLLTTQLGTTMPIVQQAQTAATGTICNISVGCSLLISEGGLFSSTPAASFAMFNPPALNNAGIVYIPFSYVTWPNLNVLDVEVAANGSGADVPWTSTFGLVGSGTEITAQPTHAPFSQPSSLLVAACHGQVYSIDNAGNVTQATGLSTPLKTLPLVNMAFLAGTSPVVASTLPPCVFMVDGTNFIYWQTTDKTTHAMTAVNSSTLPTNCSLICNWRGRLVLAGDSSNPANVYMSRVGNPQDFNYANLDPSAAVALQFSTAGQLGEPVMALMPFSDDYLLIGCTNSLWMCQGDPADGGTIVRVSNSMGMTANNAWCVGPDGTLYFIARGGMYSVKPAWEFYRPPEVISAQTFDTYFQSIIAGNFYLSMSFDVDRHFIHIFATQVNEELTGTHLIYDVRNGGFWPQYYPHNYSPTCSTTFFANAQNNRPMLMMGGFDGVIRYWDKNALDDDGTAISSYALLGPVKADAEMSILSGLTIDMGEPFLANTATAVLTGYPTQTGINWNATATLFSGPDAFSVTEGAELGGVLSPYYNNPPVKSPHSFSAITMTLDRRQKTFRQRLRGGWHSLMISNSALDAYWSFESASFGFTASGKNRERR
jgi:hypothetical protein